ncbi:hypothetical protein MRB53_041439 [Persea americana]|nr:hypothetical protein MRB53_041439 [Persea americana]
MGVLRFVVQFAINDIVKSACMVEGIEKITHDLTRYALLEQIYLAQPGEAAVEFRSALTRVYTAVLRYEAEAVKFCSKHKDREDIAERVDRHRRFPWPPERNHRSR